MLQTRKINDETCAVAFEPTEIMIRKSGKAYFGKEKYLARINGGKLYIYNDVAEEFGIKIYESKNETPEEFFGVVRWCDDDLREALTRDGYKANEDNVAKVRHLLEHHSFIDHMVEAGWSFIEYTIAGAVDLEEEEVVD